MLHFSLVFELNFFILIYKKSVITHKLILLSSIFPRITFSFVLRLCSIFNIYFLFSVNIFVAVQKESSRLYIFS